MHIRTRSLIKLVSLTIFGLLFVFVAVSTSLLVLRKSPMDRGSCLNSVPRANLAWDTDSGDIPVFTISFEKGIERNILLRMSVEGKFNNTWKVLYDNQLEAFDLQKSATGDKGNTYKFPLKISKSLFDIASYRRVAYSVYTEGCPEIVGYTNELKAEK